MDAVFGVDSIFSYFNLAPVYILPALTVSFKWDCKNAPGFQGIAKGLARSVAFRVFSQGKKQLKSRDSECMNLRRECVKLIIIN